MQSRWQACYEYVLGEEGGWSDHPADNGGQTMNGVTQGTYTAWRRKHGLPARSVRLLTKQERHDLYKEDFWNEVRGHELPVGVDLAVYDFAVNSGPTRAIMAMQRALRVADDGDPGPITMRALIAKDPTILVNAICADRLTFVRRLSDYKHFGRGWERRILRVETKGTADIRASRQEPKVVPLPVVQKAVIPPPPDIEPIEKPAKPTSWWGRFCGLFS